MFNSYIWETYLAGGGKETVAFFETAFSGGFSKEYADKVANLHKAYCPSKSLNNDLRTQMLELFASLCEGETFFEDDKYYSFESAMNHICSLFLQGNEDSFQKAFDAFSGSIEYFSTLFAIELNELFLPYYFKCNFNLVEKIADEFDIELPDLPAKRDYENRILYYRAFCSIMYDFRMSHNMTSAELCAFLYDFAPNYVGGMDSYIIKALPEPKSAYFIGGKKGDAFLSQNADEITCWQCSPDTRAGDMIVMYLKTPISAIDSVWRSVSVGFNDPFFYYYRCTYIANPVGIERISQKNLQEDAVLGALPIVKKNLQGIDGVELLPSHYNRLMDMAKADVPRLEFCISNGDTKFALEKDVENQLIKPLLEKLGFSKSEYVQQLYIEIGNRNHALIPDFVILPCKTKGHYSAHYLIEAKLTIPTLSYLEEVKTQARSYAKLLGAKYSVIASKEKLWITAQNDDYSTDVFSASWDELKNADVFSRLLKLIGKGAIQ